MAVATRVLTLGTSPVDLATIADVAAEIAATGESRVFVQNTGAGKTVVLAEQTTAPTAGSRDGVILRYGDGVVLRLERDLPFWAWSTTSATLALARAD